MNKKSNQSSTKDKRPAKRDTALLNRYQFYKSWRNEASEAFIEQLIAELIEWVSRDDSLIIQKFYIEKGITRKTFSRWRERFPQLDDAFKYAKNVIAIRREESILKKDDPRFVQYTLPMYSEDWKELDAYHDERAARRSNKESDGNVTIKVVREDFTKDENDTR